MTNPKKLGRPPLPKSKLKTYQRMAVYPQTHKRIVKNAKKANMKIVDYMEKEVS